MTVFFVTLIVLLILILIQNNMAKYDFIVRLLKNEKNNLIIRNKISAKALKKALTRKSIDLNTIPEKNRIEVVYKLINYEG